MTLYEPLQYSTDILGKRVNTKTALLKMQEIDSMYDKVRRRLLTLQKATQDSDELASSREQVDSLQQELHTVQAEQKDMEMESRSLTEKIRTSEKELMSGKVRNPKELTAMEANIIEMKSRRTTLEDRSVDHLVLSDNLQDSLAEKRAVLAKLEQAWTERMTALETEVVQRKKEYLYLKKAREQVAGMLSSDNLELYEYLRKRKNGVAIARLEDEMCGSCHTQVATGILNKVRYRDELLFCPSCGRILLTEE